MPGTCRCWHQRETSSAEHRVGERRPGLLGPVAEVAVGEHDAGRGSIRWSSSAALRVRARVDPQERPGLTEVPERPGRARRPRPVRRLVVTQLEAQAPVVGLLVPEPRQHAVEPRELHRRRLGHRLGREQCRGAQFGGEAREVGQRRHGAVPGRSLERRRGHAQRLAHRLVQVVGERDPRPRGEVVGQHLEPGRGVQPARPRFGHDALLGERQARGVREQVPDGRALRPRGLVEGDGLLLDGEQRGHRDQELGHRREREAPVDLAVGRRPRGGHDGGRRVLDGPVVHAAQALHGRRP